MVMEKRGSHSTEQNSKKHILFQLVNDKIVAIGYIFRLITIIFLLLSNMPSSSASFTSLVILVICCALSHHRKGMRRKSIFYSTRYILYYILEPKLHLQNPFSFNFPFFQFPLPLYKSFAHGIRILVYYLYYMGRCISLQ